MSENVNRKACDRCHSQKLSCKRIGDGVCDRCLRLNAECKSSPSLRYKKQLQQQDQAQEQEPQQQSQQPEQSQLSHHRYQDQQKHQPRLYYQQGQSVTCQNALNFDPQPHIEAQDNTERRSPKRRRTGSELYPVQRDAGFPIVATDATLNPGLQGHLMTTPDGSAGLAEYTINLRNMNYTAMSQPPMPPNHLLGSQVPPGVDDYFNLPQDIPSLWPHHQPSHEDAQQLPQHPHLVPQHDQQQPVFCPVSVAPLVVPDPAVAQQQQDFSSHYHHQLLHNPKKVAPILGSRRRPAIAPALSYATFSASPQTDRRSRSNKVQISYTDLVTLEKENSVANPQAMDQFFEIYARLRVLSAHLEILEQGKDYSDGPDGKPNEFTIAELYKHTHHVVNVLEQVVAIRRGGSDTGNAGSSISGGGSAEDTGITAGDLANGMFTVALYAQILDVMQRLFTHVRGILAAADPRRDDTFAAWLLPKMNIGAASIDAHPSFHMSLTVQLAMQFLGRLRETVAFLLFLNGGEPAAAANGNGKMVVGPGVSHGDILILDRTSLSFANLQVKDGELSKTLGELQEELNYFMDAMDAIDALEDDETKKK